MNQYINNPEETKELLPRFRLLYAMLVMSFFIFGMRLWYLQIIQGNELREFSEKNRIKQVKNIAPRGNMLDREGRILVENHPGFEAVISPQYVRDLDALADKLAPMLETTPEKLIQKVVRGRKQNGPFSSVKLKENLSRDEVFRLKRIRLDTPGLDIREVVVRHYPLGENGAQVFGYVGEISKKQLPVYNRLYQDLTFEQGDIIGKSGMEEVLERDIRGQDGYQILQVDAFGREAMTQQSSIYGEQVRDIEPVPGSSVILTIDKDIQEAAWKAITDLDRIGGVVVMKSDGEILAWVSRPSFDPNSFSRILTASVWNKLINDPFKPLRNKVTQDHYPPGSTFKPFVALAALEEKVITPSTHLYCPGSMRFGRREYHDSHREGHGNISVYEALERSSNIFFYKMGIALGIDRMYNYISPMGLGAKTGIEIPREVQGMMPNSAWKLQTMREEWQPGENLSNAIGQGFVEASPIQLAVGYNTIGLEGKVVKPYVIKKIVDVNGNTVKESSPEILRDLTQTQVTGVSISTANFKVVKEGLRRVVQGERGTGRALRIPGIEIAGKTGTAQVIGQSASEIYAKCQYKPISQRHHGWFVGFAPADNPEITVAALALHSCGGATGAGPLVKAVMEAYFKKYHPEKMEEGLRKLASKKAAPSKVTAPVQAVEGDE